MLHSGACVRARVAHVAPLSVSKQEHSALAASARAASSCMRGAGCAGEAGDCGWHALQGLVVGSACVCLGGHEVG